MTKQTERLVKGAIILSVAGLIAKILSAFYRIPLTYLVGNEGLGYYSTVYPFYSILTAAAIVGIPNGVSKLVAEEVATGQYKKADKTFKDALLLTSLIGAFVSIIMLCASNLIIQLLDWHEGSKYVIWGLAVSPIFISVTGAIRGYFQGMQMMKPTAITQIIENLAKVIVGLALVVLLLKKGYSIPFAVGGAALGASAGFVISAIFMVICYRIKKKEFAVKIAQDKNRVIDLKYSQITKKILTLAIPVTIASAAYSIMNMIDSATMYKELAQLGYNRTYAANTIGEIAKAFSIVNVPLTISLALSVSIVPAISEAVAKKNKAELTSKINKGIKLALLLALPSATGLCILAKPIFQLLYPDILGYQYLQVLSICLIFMIVGQTLAGILQGISKQYIPLFSLGAAILIKIIINTQLVSTQLEGIGAVIGSVVYYVVFVAINYLAIKLKVKFKMDIKNTLLKPIISIIIMGILVYFSYNKFVIITNSNAISTLIAVAIGAMTYVMALLITRALTQDDLVAVPKSEKIINQLKRMHLVR